MLFWQVKSRFLWRPNLITHATLHPSRYKLVAVAYALLVSLGIGALLTVVDPLKYVVIAGVNAGEPITDIVVDHLREEMLLITIYGLVFAVSAMVWIRFELVDNGVSQFFLRATGWPFWTVFLATLFWLSQAYIYPGYLLGGDSLSHLVRAAHFARTLANGELPIWDSDFYLGVPFVQFYPPLFIWLAGGINAVISDIATAAKLVLLAANLGGAVGILLWLRVVGLSRFAGMVGAIVYIGSWGHGHLLLYQGLLPAALVMAMLPFCFLGVERLISPGGATLTRAAMLSLCVALLFYAHQAHAVIAGLYLGPYAIVRWLIVSRSTRTLGLLVGAAATGIVAASNVLVPYVAEQHWVIASAGAELPRLTWPTTEYLGWLLTWGNSRTSFGADSAAYLGYSALALSLAGIVSLRSQLHWPFTLLALALFVLSLSLRGLLARDIVFTVLFLAPLAALGAEALARAARYHIPALIFLVLLADLGIVAIQPLPRTDKAYQLIAGDLMATFYQNANVLLATVSEDGRLDMDVGPQGSLMALAPVATIGGPHNHGATPVHNYLFVAAKLAERDLNADGVLRADTQALLARFDVAAIVARGRTEMGLPERISDAQPVPGLGRVLEVDNHSPVVFSGRLISVDGADLPDRPMLWAGGTWGQADPVRERVIETLEMVLRREGYASGADTADALLVRDASSRAEEPEQFDLSGHGIQVVNWQKSDTGSVLVMRSDGAGWAQVVHPWYPTLAVSHNGKRIDPLKSVTGLLVVPVDRGENVYEIEPKLSVLRLVMNSVSACAFIIIGFAVLRRPSLD